MPTATAHDVDIFGLLDLVDRVNPLTVHVTHTFDVSPATVTVVQELRRAVVAVALAWAGVRVVWNICGVWTRRTVKEDISLRQRRIPGFPLASASKPTQHISPPKLPWTMRLSQKLLVTAVTGLLGLPSVFAQSVIGDISLGHEKPLSRDRSTIPNWKLTGEGFTPIVFSDRLALTPPYPGNARGAIWADNKNPTADFTISFEFRASGPERASGNLQIWYVKDKPANAHESIYTVSTFDGLALVIDQYGAEGGSIRGFLNDGSQNYKGRPSVDTLAFGHCTYAYRNLGRYSRLQISQSGNGLQVKIDDRTCFETKEVSLPSGYYFGISAASAENPDSFEVAKFAVSSYNPTAARSNNAQAPNNLQNQNHQQSMPLNPQGVTLPPREGHEDQQLVPLLREIQGTIASLQKGTTGLQSSVDQKCGNVPVGQLLGSIQGIERRLSDLEKSVQQIQRDVESRDYKQTLNELQQALRETQSNLLRSLPQSMGEIVNTSAPRMGFFIFLILAFQLALAGSYIIYKRRRANMPKKFL